MPTHLLILGDQDALGWVLRNERMAFDDRRARDAATLNVGDRLYLYTTRGCFRNPTRDRGRVIGKASVTSGVERLDEPVVVMGREFVLGCRFALLALAPRRAGVVLSELVSELAVFPNKEAWSARMRRPLLSLPVEDARLIEQQLAPLLHRPSATLAEYI